ncbi:hypothetical protein [Erythrobacter sp.]|uniref:hypothetical protein n=1 Tax=Erythrobacter sp. TaxID=1042 RepID=UPI0025D65829|nr:hypothetical protein [Erythrobacter sp.]
MNAMSNCRILTIALACFAAMAMLSGCMSASGRTGADAQPPINVMVIATLHSAHADNPRYSYDDLYTIVRAFAPDAVGVEIRDEDMHRDANYLAANYPLEMRELARDYGSGATGLDWLGHDLEGRAIPVDYWREQSEIKRLQRDLSKRPDLRSPQVEAAQRQQQQIIQSATAASLNDGRYDKATREYYHALSVELRDTPLAPLSAFYAERDRQIARNASRVIKSLLDRKSPETRVVFVVGADHRAFLIDALVRDFGNKITLVPVVQEKTAR